MRLVCLTGIFIIAIISGILMTPKGPILLTYTNPRLAEFLAGAWIGATHSTNLNRNQFIIYIFMCSIFILILAVMSIFSRELFFGAISIMILSSFLLLEKLNRVPKIAFIKLLGDASYAVYLFQQFAFDGVRAICLQVNALTGLHFQNHAAAHVLSVAAALVLGLAVFLIVERPLTRSIRRVLAGPVK